MTIHSNGTTAQPSATTPDPDEALADAPRFWDEMSLVEQQQEILDTFTPARWFSDRALLVGMSVRHNARAWYNWKALGKERGVDVYGYEKAVDKLLLDLKGPQVTASTPVDAEPPARFNTITASALYAKVLPPLQWAIPGVLPAGGTLFIGRGKDGKSLAVWNICLAVATGGKAFGVFPVEQGDVLYLALEDGERRAQQRLSDQMAYLGTEAVPDNLDLVLWDAPRMGEGFETALTAWLDEHPDARLVVIDILEKVRPRRSKGGQVYADDYAASAPLTRIAQDRGVAVVIVHHSNKSNPEDFRDSASGSNGLLGGCDTLWRLSRIAGKADAMLSITGRDVHEQELAMQFQDGFWTVLGDAETYRLSKESLEVLGALTNAGRPLTPKELATKLGIPIGTIRVRLKRMIERGEVLNHGEGYIPRTPPPPPSSPPSPKRERESEKESVTPVMDVTDVRGVTGVTLGLLDTELQVGMGGGVTLFGDVALENTEGYGEGEVNITEVTGVTGVTGRYREDADPLSQVPATDCLPEPPAHRRYCVHDFEQRDTGKWCGKCETFFPEKFHP